MQTTTGRERQHALRSEIEARKKQHESSIREILQASATASADEDEEDD